MNEESREPSGDEVEWDALFRSLRGAARRIAGTTTDPIELNALIGAVEMLRCMDPSAPKRTVVDVPTDYFPDDEDDEGDAEQPATLTPVPTKE